MNIYLKIVLSIIAFILIALISIYGYFQYKISSIKNTHNLEERVDKVCKKLIDNKEAVGFTVGVVKDGKIYINAFGYSDLESKTLMDTNKIFEIGSISKVFTTEITEILHSKKILNWDENIINYFPKNYKSKINDNTTLLHLSSHSSGYPGLPKIWFPILEEDTCNPYKDLKMENLLDYIKNPSEKQVPSFDKSEYSNLGNGILGHLLEWKTGKSYEMLLQEEICQKIGLKNTSLFVKDNKKFVNGYDKNRKKACHWDFPILYSAGAIRSDITDMTNFLNFNIQEGEFFNLIKETHKPIVNNLEMSVGKGWHIDELSCKVFGLKKIIWHNGGTGGFSTYMGFDPDKKFGVVILANQGDINDDIDLLGLTLLTVINKTSFSKK